MTNEKEKSRSNVQVFFLFFLSSFGVSTPFKQFNISVDTSCFEGRMIIDRRRRIQLRTFVVFHVSRRDRSPEKSSSRKTDKTFLFERE